MKSMAEHVKLTNVTCKRTLGQDFIQQEVLEKLVDGQDLFLIEQGSGKFELYRNVRYLTKSTKRGIKLNIGLKRQRQAHMTT